MCGYHATRACCEWIMYFITRIYQIVSWEVQRHNARYEG
jgi:hypothetical protein